MLGVVGLHTLSGCGLTSLLKRPTEPVSFGPLQPDQGRLPVLDLPEGYTAHVLAQAGNQMSDGFYRPMFPAGMGAFQGPDGVTLLLCNHQVDAGAPSRMGAFGFQRYLLTEPLAARVYDPGTQGKASLGGVTTIVYDARTQRVVGRHLSLAGTLNNCGGGATPWNTWISCEQSVQRADEQHARDHGYNFEVPASAEPTLTPPVPLVAMGRFLHGSLAVASDSGIVYQTESRPDGLLYRFLPATRGRLEAGGRLQALALAGPPGPDLRNWADDVADASRRPFEARWIDLEEVDSPEDALRHQGGEKGCVPFAQGAGMTYWRGAVYFACSTGGRARKGQIWRYVPGPSEGTPREQEDPGRLELFFESSGGASLEHPGHLTVAPWGDLLVCAASEGAPHLVGFTPSGQVYPFARNAFDTEELAGATAAPGSDALFVNIHRGGMTVAITGP